MRPPQTGQISIHAPHTGRDGYIPVLEQVMGIISIHAPHTGRDHSRTDKYGQSLEFQSTRPIRGATAWRALRPASSMYFNPRAPYGARLEELYYGISRFGFQSTRPIRGATVYCKK